MGFSGAFALVFVADEAELEWWGSVFSAEIVTSRHVTDDVATGDAATVWLSVCFDDEDPFWEREEALPRVVDQTGRPALVGLCLDSDFLGVVGRTPAGATWSGVVDAEAALECREEGLEAGYDVDVPAFDTTEAAVAGALDWSAAAGLEPVEAELRRIFAITDPEQPADGYWAELVQALGLT